jgi:hypothetical protein
MAARFLGLGGALVLTTTFRVAPADLALAAFGRAGRVAFTPARLRATVPLEAPAFAVGFRAFLALFAAGRAFDAVRFRRAAFFAVRPRADALRAPPVFFACPERRRGARAAFRLAMARPFLGGVATLTVSGK